MPNIDTAVLEGYPEHRRLLEQAEARFRSDPRVVGLVVSGSIGRGQIDFYSDIDLEIFVRDEDFDTVFSERHDVAEAVGEPLFLFDADHLPFKNHIFIVLYRGAVKLDYQYEAASEINPQRDWSDRLIIKDTDGLLATTKASWKDAGPAQPDSRRLLALNQKFWTWCWYVFGKIVRGELWEALDGLHGIRSLALLPMLAWTGGTPREGYRRLEQKLDAATTERLALSVATLDCRSLHAALTAEIDLFLDLRATLFERHGLSFDQESEQALVGEMDRHWSMHQDQW